MSNGFDVFTATLGYSRLHKFSRKSPTVHRPSEHTPHRAGSCGMNRYARLFDPH